MVYRCHFFRTHVATFDLQPLRQAFKALAHLDVRNPAAGFVVALINMIQLMFGKNT